MECQSFRAVARRAGGAGRVLLQGFSSYIPATTGTLNEPQVINLWFRCLVADREQQPDAGGCTQWLHGGLGPASVGPRFCSGAEVTARRSPKSPPRHPLGVQLRLQTGLPRSAY